MASVDKLKIKSKKGVSSSSSKCNEGRDEVSSSPAKEECNKKQPERNEQQQQQQQPQAVEVTIDMTELHNGPDATQKTFLSSTLSLVKTIFSSALLLFCILIVSAAIFEKQTTATGEHNLHPVIAFLVFWILLLWLALMEGSLNCMVGLKPIDQALYSHSHPLTTKCTTLTNRGDNIDRFIVGRQYLDLMVVFLTSFMVSSIDNATVLGLPQQVTSVFLASGLAVILVTIVVGQLVAQINSAHSMLDFVNNYIMLLTTYAALTIEASGILHAVYLVQIIVIKLSGQRPVANESDATTKRSTLEKVTFWIRVAFSVTLLAFAFVITFKAMLDGHTTMWEGVPVYVSVLILAALILVVGIMEGLQIACMASLHLPECQIKKNPAAHKNYHLIFSQGSHNLQAFLVGRQILQTIIMFVIARITTLDTDDDSESNVFGVPDVVQQVFNTGILGALISTIVASLTWRVVANTFPMAFLSNPLSRPILRLCLVVESTGICSVAWTMAKVHRKLCRLRDDSYHLGLVSPEQKMDLGLTERGSSDSSQSHDDDDLAAV